MWGAEAEEGHVQAQCLFATKGTPTPPLKLKNQLLQKSHAWAKSGSAAPPTNNPPRLGTAVSEPRQDAGANGSKMLCYAAILPGI